MYVTFLSIFDLYPYDYEKNCSPAIPCSVPSGCPGATFFHAVRQ